MLIVTVANGPDKGSVFRLEGDGPHPIGRHNAAIRLSDGKVSRRHAQLLARDDQWFLEDLDSRTGTIGIYTTPRNTIFGTKMRIERARCTNKIDPMRTIQYRRARQRPC